MLRGCALIRTTAKRDFIVTAPAPSHAATGASRTRTGLRTAVSKTVVMEEVDAYHRQVQQQDAMYRRTYDRMKAEQAAKERMKREQRQKMFERALRGPVASGKRQKPVAKLTKMPDVREVERLADIHGQGGVADDGCVLAEGMAIDHQVAVASSVAPAQQQSPSQSTRSLVIFPEPQTANHGMCSTNSLPAASMTLHEQPASLSTSMQSLRTSMQELVAHNQGKPLPLTTSHRRLLPRAGSQESVASSVRSSSKITKGTSSLGNLDNTTHLIRNMTAADVAAMDDCLRRLNVIESWERRIQSNLVDADRVYATDSAAIGAYGCVGMSLPAPLSLARDHLSNSTLHVDAPPRRRGRPRRDITLSEDTAMRIREAQHARRSHELDLMKRYPLPADVTAWELQEKLATDILGEVADEVVGEYHVALDWIVDDLIREEFE